MNPWGGNQGELTSALDVSSAQAFALLLVLPAAVRWGGDLPWEKVLISVGLAESLCILTGIGDLFVPGAPSFGSAFLACLMPLLFPGAWLSILIFLAAIIVAKGATAFLILAVLLVVHIIQTNRGYWWGLLTLGVGFVVGFLTQGVNLFQEGTRLPAWQGFLSWWWANCSHAFGTGTGTFSVWGPHSQGWTPPLWLFMHNDWLQVLFEQGIIGVILALALFSTGMVRASQRGRLLFAGYGVFMLTFSPLHFLWSGLLAAYILNEELE